MIIANIPWAPHTADGQERRIVVRAASTVELYVALGDALAREAAWWSRKPTKEDLTHVLRTAAIVPEPGEDPAAVLLTPPELTPTSIDED